MPKKIFFTLIVLTVAITFSYGQTEFKFAHVSDTHIGNSTAAEDLHRTVLDINSDTAIRFVILSGDITEFGADEELTLAKKILDSLNKPWYIIPGNHDGNWSESGGNSFRKIFGSETFNFNYGGYTFLGTYCGPNMRMSPGQVPRENIVWLDSTLQTIGNDQPIIYVNHYPQDSSLNNWYEALDRLKKKNVQLLMCGHGHNNHLLNFEGIPSIMGRSNLRARKEVGGYNIVTVIPGQKIIYQEKTPGGNLKDAWAEVVLENHHFANDTNHYYRPSYQMNGVYNQVDESWVFQDNSDIGNGSALWKKYVITANTNGDVYALNYKTGKKTWTYKTAGKIYSTPAVADGKVVVGSSDNNIYCLNAKNGKLLWKHTAKKAVLGSPVIKDGVAYIGASDGIFRAIDLNTGISKWEFDGVQGFVVAKPLVYQNKIYFGSWGRELYALDLATGKLAWKWDNGHGSRMYSPAACYPVGADGRIFIVAPDRFMTCFDAVTGKVIWRKGDPQIRVRESMGLSTDSSMVYAKTMEGDLLGFSVKADSMEVLLKTPLLLGYELAPTAIVEHNNIIFVPSHDGEITAVSRTGGVILWKHKISNCLINHILPVNKNKIVVTTMDGKVACLRY
ncbi:MAG TPA: PQQ-binding-like beta-propeller repeat protein [Chitinophagaceae bacterium]